MRLSGPLALVVAFLVPAVTAWAQVQEPNFAQTTYVADPAFNDATGMAWAPDGTNRLFVAMKGGAIRIVQNGALLATP
ncbi:MAG: hypothetical protein EHM91_16755, partial [Planctomycetota bacterium]